MPNYRVAWDAPESFMAPGSPAEDHYRVDFGGLTQDVGKGSVFADFMDVTAPGQYASFVQLMDQTNTPIGPQAIGPVVTIDEAQRVSVHIPENVSANIRVEEV